MLPEQLQFYAQTRQGVIVSYLLWPLLMAGAITANYLGTQTSRPILFFNGSYFLLAGVLFLLERVLPHERQWLRGDTQLIPDLGHTLLSKSAVQTLILLISGTGLTNSVEFASAAWWPHSWPLAAQVLLGLVVAEFGLYWAHRLSHKWPPLWRFHSVHHSVTRLWFFNTGRFHFVNTIVSVTFSLGAGLAVGVPKDIIIWVGAVTAYIGLLTHCNIEMRFGVISYLFNTPALHRWHHSMVREEGDRNYGENLVLFDLLFGTFINPNRRPPVKIGTREPMPETLHGQLLYPFHKNSTSRAKTCY